MKEPLDIVSRYARLPENNGCRNACLTHLVLMVLLCVFTIVWIVQNRAWEYVIRIIW